MFWSGFSADLFLSFLKIRLARCKEKYILYLSKQGIKQMTRTETRAAARHALKRFVQENRLEVDTREYSSVIYKEEMKIVVTFLSATKRNPDRLIQHVYNMDCSFDYMTDC
jgi:hypothetical protein